MCHGHQTADDQPRLEHVEPAPKSTSVRQAASQDRQRRQRKQTAKITYIEHDGAEHTLDLKPGLTLMEGAVRNNVPGIEGDCGRGLRDLPVYIDEVWLAKTGDRSVVEKSMPDFAEYVEPNSRRACQVTVSNALDGLIVRMPESQH